VTASKRYWAQDIIEPEVEVRSDGRIVQRMDSGIGLPRSRRSAGTVHRSQAGIHGMIVYEADWVCPISSPSIPNGAIGIENGRLTKVGRAGRRRRFASRPL